jgi:hypothetical protein
MDVKTPERRERRKVRISGLTMRMLKEGPTGPFPLVSSSQKLSSACLQSAGPLQIFATDHGVPVGSDPQAERPPAKGGLVVRRWGMVFPSGIYLQG